MRMISWTGLWTIVALFISGTWAYLSADLDLIVLQSNMRISAAVFFMIGLIVGGVLTTDSAYRSRAKKYYREDWSFICVLVTISLFGISLFLH
ncbi:hypothetical protein IC620_13475 [Hazenella sp. IB182357]|uniref:Uncharacterized protein n=1 Tax=Polycladospora coralii TaxID=2771432 RepID=A0A926NGW4_9BACL|nr:hypothetical protein [Polycladospora coralii]MBD1373359.1 hypothetical protein [Polycladospora coralii]MBS7531642.1 hypothetical protein [Polycladospora coralii]